MSRALYAAAGWASALSVGAALAIGLAHSLRGDGRLPTPDLRYMPFLVELVQAGRHAEASDELYMASLLDPANDIAVDLLAQTAGRLGDRERELHALRQLLRRHPRHPALHLRYAQAVVAPGPAGERPTARQLERAVASAELALARDPGSAAAHAALGQAQLLRGEPAAAERHLREALRLDPELEVARRGLAQAQAAGSGS
jgi:tetratricopeptide (TPR) repeat protein